MVVLSASSVLEDEAVVRRCVRPSEARLIGERRIDAEAIEEVGLDGLDKVVAGVVGRGERI